MSAVDTGEETCQYGVVDLGLSVNWADHNVSAETPDDPGYDLTFDTNTGEVKMMIAENYFIMSVRPVHD